MRLGCGCRQTGDTYSTEKFSRGCGVLVGLISVHAHDERAAAARLLEVAINGERRANSRGRYNSERSIVYHGPA